MQVLLLPRLAREFLAIVDMVGLGAVMYAAVGIGVVVNLSGPIHILESLCTSF